MRAGFSSKVYHQDPTEKVTYFLDNFTQTVGLVLSRLRFKLTQHDEVTPTKRLVSKSLVIALPIIAFTQI